jgi:hypothetical protein
LESQTSFLSLDDPPERRPVTPVCVASTAVRLGNSGGGGGILRFGYQSCVEHAVGTVNLWSEWRLFERLVRTPV